MLRTLAAAGSATVLFVLWAAPAAAGITGDCTGQATIAGVIYDQQSTRVEVPADPDLQIPWRGEVGFENRNHSGSIRVMIVPAGITVGRWGDPNDDDDRDADGSYELREFFEQAPVDLTGAHLVTGEHTASGGSCSGRFTVVIEGNPLTSPVGAAAHVGLALSVAGVAVAAVART